MLVITTFFLKQNINFLFHLKKSNTFTAFFNFVFQELVQEPHIYSASGSCLFLSGSDS